MWTLIAGLFMGWSLGANDAANLFGPMVASAALKFWTAAGIAAATIVRKLDRRVCVPIAP